MIAFSIICLIIGCVWTIGSLVIYLDEIGSKGKDANALILGLTWTGIWLAMAIYFYHVCIIDDLKQEALTRGYAGYNTVRNRWDENVKVFQWK